MLRLNILFALSLLTAACGGGLSHTVDDAALDNLNDDQRASLTTTETALKKADGDKKAAESARDESHKNVATSEKEVAAKERALELARSKLAYEEARKAYLELRSDEADKALVVARARHELAKVKTVGKKSDETAASYQARVAQFEAQLAEAEAEHAEARQASAEKKEAMHEAQNDIGDA